MKLISLAQHDLDEILALNNRHATELSWLEMDRLRSLVAMAWYGQAVIDQPAFLIAFDQDSPYDSPNFLWFRERLARFIYIDRIVVDFSARRLGLAQALYLDLFDRAQREGHDLVCCEVNRDPPNPASDRFHDTLGFRNVGEASIASGKTVRYISRSLVIAPISAGTDI